MTWMNENLYSHQKTKSLICDFNHCILFHGSFLPVAMSEVEYQKYIDLRLKNVSLR